MTRPSQRREMVEKAVARHKVSIALACRAFGVSETCYRHSPKLKDENEEIADLLVGLTDARKTWGFGLCFLHLRNVKGHPWNHKRVFARLFARQGRHMLIVLDDALVYSDDDRIIKMFTALTRVAQDQQIIVFSCRQLAFQDLGGERPRVEITDA